MSKNVLLPHFPIGFAYAAVSRVFDATSDVRRAIQANGVLFRLHETMAIEYCLKRDTQIESDKTKDEAFRQGAYQRHAWDLEDSVQDAAWHYNRRNDMIIQRFGWNAYESIKYPPMDS